MEFYSRRGRAVLAATVLASGVAFLDSTVVNVALPAIGREFDSGLSILQWIVDGYLLTLGALVLVGGSLGDLLGRRRVFETGMIAFAVMSIACGIAPTGGALVAARLGQGVAAALLVPNSLAVLNEAFDEQERGRAIGAWAGLSGVSTAIGPLIGGYLVDAASWRWVFLINLPFLVVAYALSRRSVPGVRRPRPARSLARHLDLVGAALVTVGLALVVFPLIEYASLPPAGVAGVVAGGVAVLGAAAWYEASRERRELPVMLPVSLFRQRPITLANLITFAIYGALGGALFLLSVVLQSGLGYSALEAGIATVPITVLLLVLSPPVGGLMASTGPRRLLIVGPLISAAGLVMLTALGEGRSYWWSVLPGVLVFGSGLTLVVTPVTATALRGVGRGRSGAASGINNAVARVAGLIAVAALPPATGMGGGGDRLDPVALVAGFNEAMLISAAACVAGAVAAWWLPREAPSRP